MTVGSLKIFKRFKTHRCQQRYINLTKVVPPLNKKTKIPPLLSMTFKIGLKGVIHLWRGKKHPIVINDIESIIYIVIYLFIYFQKK